MVALTPPQLQDQETRGPTVLAIWNLVEDRRQVRAGGWERAKPEGIYIYSMMIVCLFFWLGERELCIVVEGLVD